MDDYTPQQPGSTAGEGARPSVALRLGAGTWVFMAIVGLAHTATCGPTEDERAAQLAIPPPSGRMVGNCDTNINAWFRKKCQAKETK